MATERERGGLARGGTGASLSLFSRSLVLRPHQLRVWNRLVFTKKLHSDISLLQRVCRLIGHGYKAKIRHLPVYERVICNQAAARQLVAGGRKQTEVSRCRRRRKVLSQCCRLLLFAMENKRDACSQVLHSIC